MYALVSSTSIAFTLVSTWEARFLHSCIASNGLYQPSFLLNGKHEWKNEWGIHRDQMRDRCIGLSILYSMLQQYHFNYNKSKIPRYPSQYWCTLTILINLFILSNHQCSLIHHHVSFTGSCCHPSGPYSPPSHIPPQHGVSLPPLLLRPEMRMLDPHQSPCHRLGVKFHRHSPYRINHPLEESDSRTQICKCFFVTMRMYVFIKPLVPHN